MAPPKVYRSIKRFCINTDDNMFKEFEEICWHERKSATQKLNELIIQTVEDNNNTTNNREQTQLDPFVTNPDYVPMPSLFDPYTQWKKHLEQSELNHIERIEAVAKAIARLASETWREKDRERLLRRSVSLEL